MENTTIALREKECTALALPKSHEVFLLENTVTKCLRKFQKANTPALAIQSKAPTLGALKKAYSEDFMLAYIELWLTNLKDFINVSRNLSDEQMEELSFMIYQNFYYFNLADINLVFSKIKKGDYGPMYESIDGPKILSYFQKYENTRVAVAFDGGLEEHKLLKPDPGERKYKAAAIKLAFKRARGFELIEKAKK